MFTRLPVHVFVLCIGLAVFAQPAAAVLDFEDLPLGQMYDLSMLTAAPDNFTTGGRNVQLQPFQWVSGMWTSDGWAQVQNGGMAGGFGNEMATNNVNLRFGLPAPLGFLRFQFGEYGGNINMDIDGTFLNFNNFIDVNGLVIGSALITVPVGGFGNDMGVLAVQGGFFSALTIGGQELWIDNVDYIVRGDFDGDGRTNLLDINPFVLALTDMPRYQMLYPGVNLQYVDPDDNNIINLLDINPFVAILTSGTGSSSTQTIPEPATVVLVGLAAITLLRRR